jgi:hypothetical protein
MLEKYWNISASELTDIIMLEIYQKHCSQEGDIVSTRVNFEGFDLVPLIPSIMTQRKFLRKLMINEFSKL